MNIKSDLAKQVLKALAEDPRTKNVTVDVIDQNSVITLTGTAPSDEAKDAAVEIVEGHDGVNSVIPDISVEADGEGLVGDADAVIYPPRRNGMT
jgi:osmotically-inducible protein OsmY